MKVSDYIASRIDRFPKGFVFTYIDFEPEVNKKEAVIKALNRLANSGKIAKLSKGRYYKPEVTPFGKLEPSQVQVVKDLLEEDGKTIGYLTGISIFNKFGLTSQVSNTIQIGRKEIRPNLQRGRYTISFIKQKNTINKDNIPLLQLLDSIRYIKKIPDSNIETSCRRIFAILKTFTPKDDNLIIRLALKYPPSTRALLGAMLDELKRKADTEILYETLNPITTYKFTGVGNLLSTTSKWNIS